jgi:hypothetical protein
LLFSSCFPSSAAKGAVVGAVPLPIARIVGLKKSFSKNVSLNNVSMFSTPNSFASNLYITLVSSAPNGVGMGGSEIASVPVVLENVGSCEETGKEMERVDLIESEELLLGASRFRLDSREARA